MKELSPGVILFWQKVLLIILYACLSIGVGILLIYRYTFNDVFAIAGFYFMAPALLLWLIALGFYVYCRFIQSHKLKHLGNALGMTIIGFLICVIYGFVLVTTPRIGIHNSTTTDIDKITFVTRGEIVATASAPSGSQQLLFLDGTHGEGSLYAILHYNGLQRKFTVTDYWDASHDRVHFEINDSVLQRSIPVTLE